MDGINTNPLDYSDGLFEKYEYNYDDANASDKIGVFDGAPTGLVGDSQSFTVPEDIEFGQVEEGSTIEVTRTLSANVTNPVYVTSSWESVVVTPKILTPEELAKGVVITVKVTPTYDDINSGDENSNIVGTIGFGGELGGVRFNYHFQATSK